MLFSHFFSEQVPPNPFNTKTRFGSTPREWIARRLAECAGTAPHAGNISMQTTTSVHSSPLALPVRTFGSTGLTRQCLRMAGSNLRFTRAPVRMEWCWGVASAWVWIEGVFQHSDASHVWLIQTHLCHVRGGSWAQKTIPASCSIKKNCSSITSKVFSRSMGVYCALAQAERESL